MASQRGSASFVAGFPLSIDQTGPADGWTDTRKEMGTGPSRGRRPRRPMAYDEELAERIRDLLDGEPRLTEKKMFGGHDFLIGGNMAIAASGQGGVLVRVDPVQSDKLVDTTNAELAVMRGRPMQGWLRVAAEDLRSKPQLRKWVTRGASYARSLPVKR